MLFLLFFSQYTSKHNFIVVAICCTKKKRDKHRHLCYYGGEKFKQRQSCFCCQWWWWWWCILKLTGDGLNRKITIRNRTKSTRLLHTFIRKHTTTLSNTHTLYQEQQQQFNQLWWQRESAHMRALTNWERLIKWLRLVFFELFFFFYFIKNFETKKLL